LQAMWVLPPRKTIEQLVMTFGYLKLNLVSHLPESIRRMGSGNNVTTDISQLQPIVNVIESC
jgi:hypothetical protein